MSTQCLNKEGSIAKYIVLSLVAHALLFTVGRSNILKTQSHTLLLPSPSSKIQLNMRTREKVVKEVVKKKVVKKSRLSKVKKKLVKEVAKKKEVSNKPFNNVLSKSQKFEKYIKSFNSPKYSRMAQRRGIQGTVVLGIILDEFGKVQKVNLKKSAGHSVLDKSAIEAAKTWSFNSLPYSGVEVEKKIVFKLR